MNYSEKQLEDIKKMASVYMTITEMASIMNLNKEELKSDILMDGSPANRAYYSGKNSTKLLLRKQEMELAKVGSPLALENCRAALLDMEDDE